MTPKDTLRGFTGEVVFVGINYDKNTKKHECEIERVRIQRKDNVIALNSLSCHQVVAKYSLSILQITSLLDALHEPLSASQMREICKRKDATYFRKTTLQPLLSDEIIAETTPDSKRNPNQKYYLTPKGLELLKKLTENK